jgi:UDPglucose--hexose-1-phosphate uridylyltransferase
MTEPELYALRGSTGPNEPGWSVRVIPNKFPALRIEEDLRRFEQGPLFRSMGGCGAHEVIIESPDHNLFLGHQPLQQIEWVLRTLQVRLHELTRDARFQEIVMFKNHGEGAGTSLRHPHWQLIATPVVPRTLRLKQAVAMDYFNQTGHCLYCVLRDEELASGQRVLAENDHYAAILPYASHAPFETWILPKVRRASFGYVEQALMRPLGAILKTVLLKLYAGLDNPDFNLTVNTLRHDDGDEEFFLWHLQLLPRLTMPAGFELGSGMSINTVLPEEAARYLRDVGC